MTEILAKRSKVSVVAAAVAEATSEPAGEHPEPAAAPFIEWLKPVKTGEGTAMLKSACGRFRIDRVASQASVGYTCWMITPGDLNKRLGATTDADAARRLCEAAR